MNLKESIKTFEAVQDKHQDTGSADTEPDGVFQVLLKRAFLNGERQTQLSANSWQLYYGVEDEAMDAACDKAAAEMNEAASKCMSIVADTRNAEGTKELLKRYLWRVHLETE